LWPDFVLLPDGSVGFYRRDSRDIGHEVDGLSRLGCRGNQEAWRASRLKEKQQPWQYVRELLQKDPVT